MTYNKIILEKNTVIKISDPKKMRIEVEKFLRAHEIGEKCGLFYVPKVLEYYEAEGRAVFERIHKYNSIENVLKITKYHNSIFENIGSSLAIIHQELKLPDDMKIELPPEFRSPGTEVFFHGDFNGVNVGVRQEKPSIVILDWQMTNRHGGESTYGSRYFDLIWFVNYFLWTPSIKYLYNIPINKMARLFLQSYIKEANLPYDEEMITKYSKNFFETKSYARKGNAINRRRLLLPYSNLLTKRFIESLHLINPEIDSLL